MVFDEQPNQSKLLAPIGLTGGTTYFWRARSLEASATSPFSAAQAFKTPVPVPSAPSPGGGGAPPSANDELDLRTVTILKGPSSISSWTVGSVITGTNQGGGQLCIYHSMLGKWPSTAFFGDPGVLVEGNQWVFAYIGGKWYGGAADWYRPGQACKGVDANSIGADAFDQEPLRSWVPKPGEVFAVMSTTPARAWPDMRTLDQRTNVVKMVWR